MKSTLNLVASVLLMGWIVSTAVFSIQNIQAVAIRFLLFESIKIPVGVLLAFCVGFGILLGALIPIFWGFFTEKKSRKAIRSKTDLY